MLDIIANWAVDIVFSFSYIGVFLLMILEGLTVIIPSEAIMLFSGYLVFLEKFGFWEVVLAATFGSLVGAWIFYWIGMKGRNFVKKHGKKFFITKKDFDKSEKWFRKYGEITILVLRFVPAFRSVISIPAGIVKMDLKKFTIYTFIGSFAWNVILCYLGIVLGERWDIVMNFINEYEVLIIVVTALILFYLWRNKV